MVGLMVFPVSEKKDEDPVEAAVEAPLPDAKAS